MARTVEIQKVTGSAKTEHISAHKIWLILNSNLLYFKITYAMSLKFSEVLVYQLESR